MKRLLILIIASLVFPITISAQALVEVVYEIVNVDSSRGERHVISRSFPTLSTSTNLGENLMQSITFAVPTLSTASMARQDQIDIVVNQATAAIVCCYLEHMNAAIEKGISGATAASGGGSSGFIDTGELVNLVNSVQTALRTIS